MKFNKKQIRLAIIAALVILFVGVSLFSLKIEPADTPDDLNNDTVAANDLSQNDAEQSTDNDNENAGQRQDGEQQTDNDNNPADTDNNTDDNGQTGNNDKTDKTDKTDQTVKADKNESKTPNNAVTGPDKTTAAPTDKAKTPDTSGDEKLHCTIEIRCDTIVDTSKLENQAVASYVPADGVILAKTTVEFADGESVFDILKRATRDNNIQMEFENNSTYDSAYIEGINYIYEFDAGELSGWMYKVNGQFPNYGCSSYALADGDAIVWMYTCDLGRDVGDNSEW